MHEQRNFVVLTEAGPNIGLGHVVRCSSLCDEFRRDLWNIKGLVFTEDSKIDLPLGFESCNWYERIDQLEWLSSVDMLVVDSYLASSAVIKHLSRISKRPVFIDDVIRREYESGTVIDWTIGAEKRAFFPRKASVNYYLGKSFCCLRREFRVPAKKRTSFEKIMITFGGGDLRSLTGSTLRILCKEFPNIEKLVVVGPAVYDRAYLSQDWPNCRFFQDCSAGEMREIMDTASVAICAGGQTLYELASRGLPPIAICVLENQTEDIEGFESEGFLAYAGKWGARDLRDRLLTEIDNLTRPTTIEHRSSRGMELIDGLGAKRLKSALEIQSRM